MGNIFKNIIRYIIIYYATIFNYYINFQDLIIWNDFRDPGIEVDEDPDIWRLRTVSGWISSSLAFY